MPMQHPWNRALARYTRVIAEEQQAQKEDILTLSKLHKRTVLSSDADARKSPLADQAMSEMPSV